MHVLNTKAAENAEDTSKVRKIFLNNPMVSIIFIVKFYPLQENDRKKYVSNKISTAKYQWWNFLFKNLFEQFMRLSNFYFLGISLLQVKKNSTLIFYHMISKFLAYLPLEGGQP
jgi:hypothetical protein